MPKPLSRFLAQQPQREDAERVARIVAEAGPLEEHEHLRHGGG